MKFFHPIHPLSRDKKAQRESETERGNRREWGAYSTQSGVMDSSIFWSIWRLMKVSWICATVSGKLYKRRKHQQQQQQQHLSLVQSVWMTKVDKSATGASFLSYWAVANNITPVVMTILEVVMTTTMMLMKTITTFCFSDHSHNYEHCKPSDS